MGKMEGRKERRKDLLSCSSLLDSTERERERKRESKGKRDEDDDTDGRVYKLREREKRNKEEIRERRERLKAGTVGISHDIEKGGRSDLPALLYSRICSSRSG